MLGTESTMTLNFAGQGFGVGFGGESLRLPSIWARHARIGGEGGSIHML